MRASIVETTFIVFKWPRNSLEVDQERRGLYVNGGAGYGQGNKEELEEKCGLKR